MDFKKDGAFDFFEGFLTKLFKIRFLLFVFLIFISLFFYFFYLSFFERSSFPEDVKIEFEEEDFKKILEKLKEREKESQKDIFFEKLPF